MTKMNIWHILDEHEKIMFKDIADLIKDKDKLNDGIVIGFNAYQAEIYEYHLQKLVKYNFIVLTKKTLPWGSVDFTFKSKVKL